MLKKVQPSGWAFLIIIVPGHININGDKNEKAHDSCRSWHRSLLCRLQR